MSLIGSLALWEKRADSFWRKIWLQSIICSSFFIANFSFHPKQVWLAVMLNVLLTASCIGLLITSLRREIADQMSSKSDVQTGNVGRNIIVIALTLLCLAASLANPDVKRRKCSIP